MVSRNTALPPFWQRPRLIPLIVILFVGIAVYANTFDVPFTFDDHKYIEENPAVTDWRYFLHPSLVAQGVSQGRLEQSFRTRWITILSFAVNYLVDGYNVRGFHALNLLLHLANSLLVYWLVRLTFQTPRIQSGQGPEGTPPHDGRRPAFVIALFFVSHPVQTEAVTYIYQRSTLLATMFYLLTLTLFVQWRLALDRHPGVARPRGGASPVASRLFLHLPYGLALTSATLAMFCKEIAFTLPGALLLYELVFVRQEGKKRYWPFLPFAMTMFIIPTIVVCRGGFQDVQRLSSSMTDNWLESPAVTYLLTQPRVIATYLRLLLFPINQNLDYDYPRYEGLFQPPLLPALLLLALLAAAGLYLFVTARRPAKRDRQWQLFTAFGIGWFFLTLAVESTIIPLNDLIFEHRLYLPSIGFFFAALGVIQGVRTRLAKGWPPAVEVCFWVILLAATSFATHARNEIWRDPIALWGDAAKKSPNKVRPLLHLGASAIGQGQLDAAIDYLEHAVRLNPSHPDALYNCGLAYLGKGDHAAAAKAFAQVLTVSATPKHLRAMATMNLGALAITEGQFDQAIDYLTRAGEIAPYNPDVFYNLAIAYAGAENYAAAAKALEQVLTLRPTDTDTRRKRDQLLEMAAGATTQ